MDLREDEPNEIFFFRGSFNFLPFAAFLAARFFSFFIGDTFFLFSYAPEHFPGFFFRVGLQLLSDDFF